MTRLIDLPSLARLLNSAGVARFPQLLTDRIAADFVRWPEFDKAARTASHSTPGVIELMPIADATHYSFKYVNGHPGNPALGLPTVMAFGVLAEVATGYLLLLAELTLTTALRTAATSLVAARALARPDSRRMALIGNGAQGEFQALAFHHGMSIAELGVFDVDPAATDRLVRNLAQAAPGLRVQRAGRVSRRCAAPTLRPRPLPTRRAPLSSHPAWCSPACT